MLFSAIAVGGCFFLAADVVVDEGAESVAPPRPGLVAADLYAGLDSPNLAYFASSDSLLEHSWEAAYDGVIAGRSNGFRDDLYAEKGPFWGDARVLCRSYLWMTGNGELSRAALSTVFHPRLVPSDAEESGEHRALAEYSLLWPAMLADYLRYTGDTAYAKAMAESVLDELFDYFREHETKSGLLTGKTLPAWPESCREDFDYDEVGLATNTVLNAFYYLALTEAVSVLSELGLPSDVYAQRAEKVRVAFQETFLDADSGLFRDGPDSENLSLSGNALALCFGLAPRESVAAILGLIRKRGTDCSIEFSPYVVEACFRAGASQLGYDLVTFLDGLERNSSPVYLIGEYVSGLAPRAPGWEGVTVKPRFPERLEYAMLAVPVPGGRVSVRHEKGLGQRVTVRPGVAVEIRAGFGGNVMVQNAVSHASGTLTDAQWGVLEAEGWAERAGDEPAIWISIEEQMLRLVRGREVLYQALCATAEKGVGSMMDSLQTPDGWHSISKKIGDDARWGQVFRARQATREVWQPGEDVREDLVLTRVLLLNGEESGRNKGGNVDSYARNIYIHGTNDEGRLGTPSSHGCVRLSNDDVIEAYRRLEKGVLVLITKG